jgi:hypothetical protein
MPYLYFLHHPTVQRALERLGRSPADFGSDDTLPHVWLLSRCDAQGNDTVLAIALVMDALYVLTMQWPPAVVAQGAAQLPAPAIDLDALFGQALRHRRNQPSLNPATAQAALQAFRARYDALVVWMETYLPRPGA